MTDLQAAIGAAQMNRADKIVKERRTLATKYNTEFSDLKWLKTPAQREGYGHGYQSYPCLFEPEK